MKPPTGCRKKEKNVVVEAHTSTEAFLTAHSFIKNQEKNSKNSNNFELRE